MASHELRDAGDLAAARACRARSRHRRSDAPAAFLRQSARPRPSGRRAASARLVDALLDVSRIAAGRLELQREPVDLSAVVRDVGGALRRDARRAGCELSRRAPEPRRRPLGSARLEQVVIEPLVERASSTAPASRSTVTRRARRRARAAGRARRRHRHRRRPISARIFERFERAVSSKHYGGLGLGLLHRAPHRRRARRRPSASRARPAPAPSSSSSCRSPSSALRGASSSTCVRIVGCGSAAGGAASAAGTMKPPDVSATSR